MESAAERRSTTTQLISGHHVVAATEPAAKWREEVNPLDAADDVLRDIGMEPAVGRREHASRTGCTGRRNRLRNGARRLSAGAPSAA